MRELPLLSPMSEVTMREAGFYWVKEPGWADARWKPAEWEVDEWAGKIRGRWWTLGWEVPLDDADLAAIGGRIIPDEGLGAPDEASDYTDEIP